MNAHQHAGRRESQPVARSCPTARRSGRGAGPSDPHSPGRSPGGTGCGDEMSEHQVGNANGPFRRAVQWLGKMTKDLAPRTRPDESEIHDPESIPRLPERGRAGKGRPFTRSTAKASLMLFSGAQRTVWSTPERCVLDSSSDFCSGQPPTANGSLLFLRHMSGRSHGTVNWLFESVSNWPSAGE